MIRMSRQVHTSAPTAVSFAVLSDFTTTEEWDPGTVSTRRISGDGEVGTRYANVSRFAGRTVETEYTVIALDRGRRIVLRGRNPGVLATDTMTVEATADGSVVTYTVEFEFQGAVRFIEPLLRPVVARLMRSGAEGLRAVLEARA